MSSPTTEAGRIYCPRCGVDWSEVAVVRNAAREARAALLAELEAGVEGLVAARGGVCQRVGDVCVSHGEMWFTTGCEDEPANLAAVLDLIRKARA